jgi:hypothetical protein
MRLTIACVAAALLALPSTASAWGFEPHKFIMSRAIDMLPNPIRPFFEANRTFVVEHTVDPDLWRSAGFAEEPPQHFVDLDAYGPYPFKDLPRDYDEALKKHGFDKLQENGLLPWRTHEMAGRLVRGFEGVRTGRPYARNDVMFFSAVIGHYVSDAFVPFHAVLNYNGQLTGQTGIHARWESELFERYQKQLVLEPGRLRPISHERDFVFDTLLESTQFVPELLAADKEAIGNRDLYDDRYFETFFSRTRPVLEKRLSEAITAVASVIASAWEQAGKPAVPVKDPPRAARPRRAGEGAATP